MPKCFNERFSSVSMPTSKEQIHFCFIVFQEPRAKETAVFLKIDIRTEESKYFPNRPGLHK